MNFKEYQEQAWETAEYPILGKNFIYPALGLGGETGEVLEKIKRIFREDDGELTEAKREELKKELGDVLWYLSALCKELRLKLNDVAEENLRKLNSRKERNQISGSGDNR